MKFEKGFGANQSPKDLRTFSYKPTKANKKGGARYVQKDITDQKRVGICTANSFIMLANKYLGKKFSPDFQYLIQKKYIDGNWEEGSSIFSACKAAHKYGMILEKDFFVSEKDRNLSYSKYIKKLQAVSDEEIQKLLKKAVKIESYAKVPVTRDFLANAIDNNEAGILVRFELGNEWFREPIEPLRPPVKALSGHAVVHTNYDGNSFRIANGWGPDWADKGTAYHMFNDYQPTEAYAVFFEETPKEVNQKVTINEIIRLLKWLKEHSIIK